MSFVRITRKMSYLVMLVLMVNKDNRVGILTHLHEDIDKFEITMNQDLSYCCSLTVIFFHIQQFSFPTHFRILRYLFLTHADIT